MKSLAGVYLKDEADSTDCHGNLVHLFMLIFPNKRSIFYLYSLQEKQMWINGIKKAIGFTSVNDYYEFGLVMG